MDCFCLRKVDHVTERPILIWGYAKNKELLQISTSRQYAHKMSFISIAIGVHK